ncbi:MAG: histidine kinase, partial [Rhodospirillales bacterium]|nr:histidine kinase [Rhodospirillales bacterium]
QVDSGLDRKHEGTGLGLPLTKALMELHGGTLEIESEKDHGSLITATFPKERVI